ncbi:MAG TPA: transposase [Blastocatellia bacterium]|nr:transposase [Blastocatellia bacterium]
MPAQADMLNASAYGVPSQERQKDTMDEQQEREQRGLVIAATSKLQRSDDGHRWFVPSQTTGCRNTYTVKPDPAHPHCTCPDFTARQQRCKHIFATEIVIQREYTDDGETQTYTETVTVKKTYKQEWRAYDKAQTHEKERFLSLLNELCKGIEESPQTFGRPRLPLADMIFASTFKVYSTVSGRRFMSDLRDAQTKGFIVRTPHYTSVSRYLENPTLTPFLKQLIEISSLPLQTVESSFAVDSSGFSTCRFAQWAKAKYGEPKQMQRHEWIKVHLMCGTKTNIVTSIEVTDSNSADSPQFAGLVKTTGRNFTMNQVSADKAYLSSDNLQVVADHDAQPFIAFKANSTTSKNHSAIWNRMFHFYSFNQTRFMQCYHKRSNVETTFHMIKTKFGDRLRSKTRTAQINEALCKVLAHNLCCLIQSTYELGIEPTFWEEAA